MHTFLLHFVQSFTFVCLVCSLWNAVASKASCQESASFRIRSFTPKVVPSKSSFNPTIAFHGQELRHYRCCAPAVAVRSHARVSNGFAQVSVPKTGSSARIEQRWSTPAFSTEPIRRMFPEDSIAVSCGVVSPSFLQVRDALPPPCSFQIQSCRRRWSRSLLPS